MWGLMVIEFIKLTLSCDSLFPIDSYDPYIFFNCAGSWLSDGKFGILSVMYGIVRSLSSSKLKPTFFTEGGNSISYVRVFVSRNGVGVRSSSHGIKLRRYEFLTWIPGSCINIKEPGECFSYMQRQALYSSNQTWFCLWITKW